MSDNKELIARAKDIGAYWPDEHLGKVAFVHELADALEQVTSERDKAEAKLVELTKQLECSEEQIHGDGGFVDELVNMQERAETAEALVESLERQIAARTGETAVERIWRERAEEAEAKLAEVMDYAKDREWYGKRDRAVHSARIASDLFHLLQNEETE